MSLSLTAIAPFRASLPAVGGGTIGGGAAGGGGAAAGSAGAAVLDPVALRLPPAGVFTAAAGDVFSLRGLLDTAGSPATGVAQWRVALRDDAATPGGGRLLLRGADVTGQLDFTAAEFNELQFAAGAAGSRTDLLVVARQGRPDGAGGLTNIVDSRPVQLAAAVTGRRSLDAAAALRTPADADDAAFVRLAQDAAVFDGLGGTRPVVETVGNLTAVAGDGFSLRGLFDAGAGAFDAIARYRVALRDDLATPGGGRLLLRGADVTSRTDFSPAEFNELQFVAGPAGGATDLLVVARRGKPDGAGGLTGIVDSAPVQITATSTGARSVNGLAALRTAPDAAAADFVRLAQDADIFDGLGGERPRLSSVGNVTVAAADTLSLRELFDAGDYGSIATWRVALRDDPATPGGGRLFLDGRDVTGQLDFTPAEFNQLQFTAGAGGAATELLVVARGGKADGAGGLTGIVDSAPVPITVSATGARSINAAGALRTVALPAEERFLGVARDAAVFDGLGAERPTLGTVGSLTAAAGDAFSLAGLFEAGSDVARFRVALRDDPATVGGGRLLLNGVDVSTQVDFSPSEFGALQFVAGGAGAATGIVVVARRGRPDGSFGLTGIVDSPALEITATASGQRSFNAFAALRTAAGAAEADRTRLVQDADIFDGLGGTRPSLSTVGNFTSAANDAFALRELFDAGANAFDAVAQFRVALTEGPGGGTLSLRGVDVGARQDFSPAEFNELQFVAGAAGSVARLTVVARAGKPDGAGGLTGIVDSPAIEITATVTGTRSLNAAPALRSDASTSADADSVRLVQDAAVFSGLGGSRPRLGTVLGPADPVTPSLLAGLAGTFRSFGGAERPSGAHALDALAALYGLATGSADRAGPDSAELQSLRSLFALLDAEQIGGYRQSGGARTALALAAYARAAG